ncbi:putative 2OG-Fe(II) oxygenase [Emcibacter nanhaiensis]|uniref:2OG-Fe(II) oxygenase n=1 Tax=Emcibacter nanhaiensis TaxID=1505037 RepID=A0A501PSN1_9PROT|nr:putative 2OG-Fe(II) oxygenase [Emcibacter nanhaiensis]TPD63107.1 hypothetical protein FIV46_03225 [Emcibacter nanhaiensis]
MSQAVEKIPLFPVEIYRTEIEDHVSLNRDLMALLQQLRTESKGITRTNVGGWHSDLDLHRQGHDAVTRLMDSVLEVGEQACRDILPGLPPLQKDDWHIESWLNANDQNAYNNWHDHVSYHRDHSTVWAGVYYVNGGEPHGDKPPEGEIVFRDDFLGPDKEIYAPARGIRTIELAPRTGSFFIFPAWLRHYVKPYRGLGERVSLAFNLAHPAIDVGIRPEFRRFSRAWQKFPDLMKKLRKVSPIEL